MLSKVATAVESSRLPHRRLRSTAQAAAQALNYQLQSAAASPAQMAAHLFSWTLVCCSLL